MLIFYILIIILYQKVIYDANKNRLVGRAQGQTDVACL